MRLRRRLLDREMTFFLVPIWQTAFLIASVGIGVFLIVLSLQASRALKLAAGTFAVVCVGSALAFVTASLATEKMGFVGNEEYGNAQEGGNGQP